jgi:hypothetical protein
MFFVERLCLPLVLLDDVCVQFWEEPGWALDRMVFASSTILVTDLQKMKLTVKMLQASSR